MKKLLAIVLCLVVALSLLSVMAFAAEDAGNLEEDGWPDLPSQIEYTWASDYSSCTASYGRLSIPAVWITNRITVNPTCEGTGTREYTAHFLALGVPDARTTQTLDALGHDWNDVTYEWSDDNATCTASRTCKRDSSHVETETVTAAVEHTTAAACETAGLDTYTATFTNAAFAQQVKEVPLDALGHDWNDVTYEWSDDNTTCTASRTCKNDPAHVETETVNAAVEHTTAATCETAGLDTYTATFTNEVFAQQVKEVPLDALGHDWNDVTYEWSDDNATCTASRTCKNDPTHVETETVNAVYQETKAPTKDATGEGVWTATFENEAFTKQTKVVTLDKLADNTKPGTTSKPSSTPKTGDESNAVLWGCVMVLCAGTAAALIPGKKHN